ncbi:MAG: hypothetical protein F7C34_04235 [Desulfurococcales archaeon]|nr:hypothetical protein [Desulfurococcales archaeon]
MKSQPYTVKDYLKLLKHYSSVAVDLALYSLLSEDREAALEVLKVESQIDNIYEELVAKVSIAVRSPDDANIAVAIANIGRALDKVSDAAGDLAGLILRGYPVHDYVKAAVNCCNEIVALLKAKRRVKDIPAIIDLLVVRRGDSYILAPSFHSLEKGDMLVVRGLAEEIEELAGLVGDEEGAKRLSKTSYISVARAGDDLAEGIIRIKSLARSVLDLAFHVLVYGDRSLVSIITELEDEVDYLFHNVLEKSYAASQAGIAREMVSVAVFASTMEQLADSAVQMTRAVEKSGHLTLVEEALEEEEEAFLRVRATSRVAGKTIGELGLSDMGINVIAIGRGGSWIIPVRPDYTLEEGDILLLKYYKPKGEASEERIETQLERMGFEVLEE